ncbi:glycine betaine/proline transport system permease protein [Aminivibrio pyruvatiphilus]|mgnify:FL=1|jgi:glycine betaine/proline transport system permease protein|uniref:Glycine betaine/proline transport system permease protein n=1 Tax=Aminivibrio pyruvatiphilus TaxID=1005740 RepID=A0A4R8MBY5_9BACT|nr:ABC transporter permease subunit [Aminivibrio pyruvatiphilus]TDY61687.1 glycine betaine/proline transport system permease protein [Aminivibrio pyruvatiphilus]
MFPEAFRYHVAGAVNEFINNLIEAYSPVFDSISDGILSFLLGVNSILTFIPWWAYIAGVFLLSWYSSKKLISSVILASLPFVIGMFGLWAMAVESLSVIITAVLMALIIGLPLGVLMAELRPVAAVLRPLLDGMQTMPSFVYLIPAMMLFGLGKVPAVLATLIYALPPVIRLTALGLNQVPKPVEEAALAYGATRWQLIREVRLPLAMPSILAGVNQTTMMALAMVVISSMIGARGLGQEVLLSINRIDVGRGFEAGMSVVFLAIVIDRLTQNMAKRWEPPKR